MRLILWIMVSAVLALLAWNYSTKFNSRKDQVNSFSIGGPFAMTDHNGATVTEKTYAGKARAMFFGFTSCPDICPTTLARMTALMKELGPDAEEIQVILVSVDPERDTPAVLKLYMSAFDSRFVGLTGTPAQLSAFAKAYRVLYRKVPTANGGYTMDHSAGVFLFDAKGAFAGTLDLHEADDIALKKLHRVLASG